MAEAAPEFDQFGTQLAGRRTIGDSEMFRYALRLPMQSQALSVVGSEIQAWMQSSTPDQIEPLLHVARNRVEEALPAFRQVLMNLWESNGDVAYASLAVGGDPANVGEVAEKWAVLPTSSCLAQAVPALDLTVDIGDREKVEDLVGRIVARVPAMPFS